MSTYTPIASQTLSTSAPSVTFSSIPQGYTDIRAVVVTAVNTATYMRFNSDSGSNYSLTEMWAGTSANSERATSISRMDLRNSSSTLGNNMATVDIMSYSNSVTYKTVLTAIRDGLYDRVYRQVQLWRNTAAITTITFTPDSGNFPTGSTFTLYGIQVGNAAAKAQGGNIVVSTGGYMYHAFTSSGSFIPSEELTADVLVIAGGGSGGANTFGGGGGGGGAGGVSYQTNRSLITNIPIACIVGAGGAGVFEDRGLNGGNSVFDTIISIGGGGGGRYGDPVAAPGKSGGSGGGGGGYQTSASILGGSATQGNSGGATGYGNAGGNGVLNLFTTGGGGGSGAVGQNGNGSTKSGDGGAGLNTWSSWASATSTGVSGFYAGGGGGGSRSDQTPTPGSGGSGGGGAGGATANGSNASPNTGSGGGGGGNNNYNTIGGNGSSGIIIIRYAV